VATSRSRAHVSWSKQGVWYVRAFDSGTQYRARLEGAGRRRALVLYRRPPNGVLEQVTTVAADDFESLNQAALSDDARRVAQSLVRCSKRVEVIDQKAADAHAACDLVRDDLARIGHLIPRHEREDLSKQHDAVAGVLRRVRIPAAPARRRR
jgi:hypothetical protein